jgi:ribosome recycling factor
MDHDLIEKLKQKLEKVLEVFNEDLNTIRTGKAKPSLVGDLMVDVYGGQKMKIIELAQVSAPSHDLITITPWDKSVVGPIEKAIGDSQLQLSASTSGDTIRVPIPSLTEERRMDFVKLLHQKIESGKIMVRQAREDIKKEIDALKDTAGVSEDDVKNLSEQMQKKVDEYVEQVEKMGEEKESELMTV